MSHEQELLTLVEEFGRVQYRAGLIMAQIQHNVRMIAIIKEEEPEPVSESVLHTIPSIPVVSSNKTQLRNGKPTIQSTVVSIIEGLGGEVDFSTLNKKLALLGYGTSGLRRAIDMLRKKGELEPSVTPGIYELSKRGNGHHSGGVTDGSVQ